MCVQWHLAVMKENGLYKVPQLWVYARLEIEIEY